MGRGCDASEWAAFERQVDRVVHGQRRSRALGEVPALGTVPRPVSSGGALSLVAARRPS